MGTNGYAWSSSPRSASSVDGSYVGFYSTNVSPEGNSHRAGGFPVRCVQLCVSREQRPPADFAEAKQSGASNGGVMDKRGGGHAAGVRLPKRQCPEGVAKKSLRKAGLRPDPAQKPGA